MRFTELLLLVSCMSPLLFVNGLQALQPTIKNNLLRRDALIPGLLVPLQFCVIGFNICWNIFCCPPDWNCCTGLSLSLSFKFEFKFNPRAKFSQTAAAANQRKFFCLQVSMDWCGSCYRSYCFAASNGIIGCCPNGTTCDGPVSTPTPLTCELVCPFILTMHWYI